MAQLNTYICGCGFEIETAPLGHYSLISGEYYTFHCLKCKDIVAVSANDILPKQVIILLALIVALTNSNVGAYTVDARSAIDMVPLSKSLIAQ